MIAQLIALTIASIMLLACLLGLVVDVRWCIRHRGCGV